MTDFERLMLCKTPEEAFQMLRDPEGKVTAAWCSWDRECSGKCDCCLKSWLVSEFSGQKRDEYKPRHMKEDA